MKRREEVEEEDWELLKLWGKKKSPAGKEARDATEQPLEN